MQKSESNTQSIDNAFEEKGHRKFETGSKDNFKGNRRPAVVINNLPERQHEFQKKKIISEEKSYSDVVGLKSNISCFNDSIGNFNRDIRSNLNKELKNGRARFKYYPGAALNDLLYYVDPTLEGGCSTQQRYILEYMTC